MTPSEPPTRPDLGQPHECPFCGWRGRERNGGGRCTDQAACAHRAMLGERGRPRESGCRCLAWPCSCPCHVLARDPTSGAASLVHAPPASK